jgi:hypothetical protein
MDFPSWLVPLPQAVARITAHRQCSRADVEWELRQQVARGDVSIVLVDRHLRPCRMGVSEWHREAPELLRTGTSLSYGRFHDGRGTKVRAFLHKDVLDALLSADYSRDGPATTARYANSASAADRQSQGYQVDTDLLAEMHVLVERGSRPYTAARKVADRAEGGGTLESKARRLSHKYKKLHKTT